MVKASSAATNPKRSEVIQKKQVTGDSKGRMQAESITHKGRKTEGAKPLVRRRHIAGIPLNDPNSVF